jgi:hypothetical protein
MDFPRSLLPTEPQNCLRSRLESATTGTSLDSSIMLCKKALLYLDYREYSLVELTELNNNVFLVFHYPDSDVKDFCEITEKKVRRKW